MIEICGIVQGTVSAEVTCIDAAGMFKWDDIAHTGMDLIHDLVAIYKNCGFTTQILAASLRHPLHVVEAARAGAHVAAMPYKVFEQLFEHPLTHHGMEKFMKDLEKVKSQ